MNRKPVFDLVRTMLGRGFTQQEVDALDAALNRLAVASLDTVPCVPSIRIGPAGIQLIKNFEGCARIRADGLVEAYPDPGSANGHPWTIGWGSTGQDIGPGTVWSQAECDARLEADLERYAREVVEALGHSATTQEQFDALVSFHYNTGAIGRATLTDKHRRGDFAGAAREFGRWVHNDGKVLKGLRNRRTAEAALYSQNRD